MAAAIATVIVLAATARMASAIAIVIVIAATATMTMTHRAASAARSAKPEEPHHGQIFPPQEVLPFHGRRRQADRLQGSGDAQELRHRDGQDRAEPHHR